MSESKLDASTGLTCISCRLVFANSDIQRDHYRTEWHRYNVKRQIAELPPISQDDFATRSKLFSAEKSAAQATADEVCYCAICKKPFQSRKAYENHLNSKKHIEKAVFFESLPQKDDKSSTENVIEAKNITNINDDIACVDDDDDDDDGSSSSSGWRTACDNESEGDYNKNDAILETSCLFCSMESSSVTNNLTHMTRKHGFTAPDAQYCCDLEGLIKYLGMKIGCGGECIACGNNVKPFCNRDACQKHMRDKNHCYVNTDGENILEYMEFYDYSELLAAEPDNLTDAYVDDGSFLVLPSGARIGHRSLFRYFKQSLSASGEAALQKRNAAKMITNGHIRALGWTSMPVSLAMQRARDMKCIKRVADTYRLKTNLNSNKLFKTRGRKDQQ